MRPFQTAIRVLLAGIAYYASARVGYALAIPHGIVTLWPPSGVILGILLLSEYSDWPAILIGAFVGGMASDLHSGFSLGFALSAAVANTGESVLAAWVVVSRLGHRVRLDNLRAVLVFMIGAPLLSNAATAVLGAMTLDHGLHGPFVRSWTVWWVGDGLGMLVVTPAVLGWASLSSRRRLARPGLLIEVALLSAALIGAAVISLGSHYEWALHTGPYALFPLLFWASLRFGPVGAASASFVLAGIGIWNAAHGVGPFVGPADSGLTIAVRVYVYLSLASLSSLIPAAVVRERHLAVRAMHASEERYRQLFDTNPQPTWVYDIHDLRFLAVNQAAIDLYGYSREEFLSMTLRDIRPLEGVSALNEVVQRLALDERVEGSVSRHRRKDGVDMDVEIFSRALEFDRHHARLVLANDVTERRRMERTLRESEERFREMAEHIQEAFFVVELPSWRPLYVSPTWATIWGRPIEDGADPSIWFSTIHPDDQELMRESQKAVMCGERRDTTFRVVRPSGEVRWVLGRSFPVRDETGEIRRMVGVSTDVTEMRRVQEQFVQSQKMEAVGRLAGGVAHDFNNHLTVILSWSAMLAEARGWNEDERSQLQEISAAGERAAGLTRQLLAFSRKQVLSPRVLDLNALLTDSHRFLRRLIGEDVEIRTSLDQAIGKVRADPGQVEQVIMNLVVNARDAMPEGGSITLSTAAVAAAAVMEREGRAPPPGGYVAMSVRDTGVGMDAAIRAHIFEPFFTTKGIGKGTGLGLATVYGIVDQSGGFIQVDSAPASGTVFTIFWPVADRGSSDTDRAIVARRDVGGAESVLVVEDEEPIREIAREILTARGYQVHVASSGEQALAIAAMLGSRIHLLLTDVIMPGMSGPELAERLTAIRPEVQVLFMSGYTDDMLLQRGALGGEARLLQKPFTPQMLAEHVRDALDSTLVH